MLLGGAVVLAGVAAWPVYVNICVRRIARDPQHHPQLSTMPTIPWRLRLAHYNTQVSRLADFGFHEIGVKVESMGKLFRVPSRALYQPEHQCYADIFSIMGTGALSFITELPNGEIVFTGTNTRPLVQYGRLHEQGLNLLVKAKLNSHQTLMTKIADRAVGPKVVHEELGTMVHRVALARRYYVQRFGARPQGPTTF